MCSPTQLKKQDDRILININIVVHAVILAIRHNYYFFTWNALQICKEYSKPLQLVLFRQLVSKTVWGGTKLA
jgi:hypothetical protein